jgi:hypothetical protein
MKKGVQFALLTFSKELSYCHHVDLTTGKY